MSANLKILFCVFIFSTGFCQTLTANVSCHSVTSILSNLYSKFRVSFYNPFNVLNGRTIQASEILAQDFYKPSDKGAIVGISGYGGFRAKLNSNNADFLTGKPFADGKKVFHYTADSPAKFIHALLDAYNKSGPIYKLALMGHGHPGVIEVGEGKLSTFWASLNSEFLGNMPKDFFAKDAEIVLLSCNCVKGNIINPNGAAEAISSIFSNFVKQGAKIYASTKIILADTNGYKNSKTDDQSFNQKIDSTLTKTRTSVTNQKRSLTENIKLDALTLTMLPIFYIKNAIDIVWMDRNSIEKDIIVIDLEAEE